MKISSALHENHHFAACVDMTTSRILTFPRIDLDILLFPYGDFLILFYFLDPITKFITKHELLASVSFDRWTMK